MITVNRDLSYCTVTTDPDAVNKYTRGYTQGSTVFVDLWQLDSNTHLEVPVDGYIHFAVHC